MDTLVLNEGCYRITIYDSGDDGLSFWANNDGNGYCNLKRVMGGTFKTFEEDFGKSISQAFYWATDIVSDAKEVPEHEGDLAVFPNPLRDELMILPAGFSGQAEWRLHNVQGQLIDQGSLWAQAGSRSVLDASKWPTGTLVLVVASGDSVWTRWVIKE